MIVRYAGGNSGGIAGGNAKRGLMFNLSTGWSVNTPPGSEIRVWIAVACGRSMPTKFPDAGSQTLTTRT